MNTPNLQLFHELFLTGVKLQRLNSLKERLFGISLAQWRILTVILANPGISAHALSTEAGLHPSSLTPQLKRLNAKGMIQIQPSASDARRKVITLTKQGADRLEQVNGRLSWVLERFGKQPKILERMEKTLGSLGSLMTESQRTQH